MSFAAATLVRPSLPRLPLVRTIHNAVIWRFSPWLGRLVDRQIAQAHVAGVSDDAVDAFLALRASSGAANPNQPPVTIYNGVRFEPMARATPSNPSVIRMVYGGRFEPEKGTDLLPEIVRLTQLPAGVRASLTIYGSGRHELALRSLEQHAPAGWTVEIRPPIPQFSAELGSFDLMLVPSRHEGLALVAIEGLLAGIQVVATDAPGLREALPASHPWRARAGDAVSFAAALQFACGNRERWPAISAFGRAFARRCFDPVLMAQGYRNLYARALATAKTPFNRER